MNVAVGSTFASAFWMFVKSHDLWMPSGKLSNYIHIPYAGRG